MALKDTSENLRKKVAEITGDVQSTRQSLRDTVREIRPKPVRNFIERKTGTIRPFKRLRGEE